MMNLVKKLTACVLLTGVMVSFTGINNASAATMYGKVSYRPNSHLGTIGHDGKAMTENDAAVDITKFYSIVKGTSMYITNTNNDRTATVYKWDSGNFERYGVVIDVFIPVFRDKLGGNLSNGYISNAVVRY
jgi:hypothetical protein